MDVVCIALKLLRIRRLPGEEMAKAAPEGLKRFRARVASLKRARRFLDWREVPELTLDLEEMLDGLERNKPDPYLGAQAVAAFFETDRSVFERCDDSNGELGWVYGSVAAELFVRFARQCDQKERLANIVLELNRDDAYGVRLCLIDRAAQYLPDSNLRTMIERLGERAAEEVDPYRKRHQYTCIESIAAQLKDAPLYEKTIRKHWNGFPSGFLVDVARVYFDSGDPRAALKHLSSFEESNNYNLDAREELLIKIYGSLNQPAKQHEVAIRYFRRQRSVERLETLLALPGMVERVQVLNQEIQLIQSEGKLSLVDAKFLLDCGRIQEASTYLIDHASELDGDYYAWLVPIAKVVESNGNFLAATLIYRALLDSILRRARPTTYTHGVRYLHKLEKIATRISDWHGFDEHAKYVSRIRDSHRLKRKFWSMYERG